VGKISSFLSLSVNISKTVAHTAKVTINEQLYSPKQATRQTETDYIHTDDKSTINSQKNAY